MVSHQINMVERRKRRWNALALVAILIATALALSAIGRIEMPHLYGDDGLHLSPPSEDLKFNPTKNVSGGLNRQRDKLLTPARQGVDRFALESVPFRIQAGVYAINTSELELEVPSYASTGYIWLRWQEPFQQYLEKSGAKVDQRFALLNELISDSDPGLQPIEENPTKLDDGSYYQLFRYQGRYYIDQASFRRYPFMRVSLPLSLEADDVDGNLTYDRLRIEPDQENSGMGLYSYIIGWRNNGWSIAEHLHHYATNFGLGGPRSDYSQLLYEIYFGTSSWAAFWRLLLPLAVVMAMILLVFKVRADDQESRASIPVTVLLTLVFLQQAYRESLPDLPFLTFLDQVYVVAYITTLAAFVLVIWVGRRYSQMDNMPEGSNRDLLKQRLELFDNLWPLAVVLFGSVAIAACWLTLPESIAIAA